MKRLYPLILLPALSLAFFLVGLLHGHGFERVPGPLWLAVASAVVVAVPASWVIYARFLGKRSAIGLERALLLDLLSYLPFLLLLAYSFPAVRNVANAGTLLFFGTMALSAALKGGVWLYYRRADLLALLARPLLIPALVIALAWLLRVSLIAAARFHGDEALYAHWGLLIASGKDLFLRSELVDKPPLFFYLLALSFKLFGPTETAARLPGFLASLAGIGVVYGIGRRLFDRRAAALGALFLALSPFDIQFAPTTFTDPPMVTLGLASGLLALAGRYFAAGLSFGLAVATKPTGLFYLPLLLSFTALGLRKEGWRQRLPEAGARLGSGLVAVVGVLACWDAVIRAGSPSFAEVGAAHYGGLRLVAAGSILPRLQGWLGLLQYITGSRVLNALLAGGVPALLAVDLWRRRERPGCTADAVLVAFALCAVGLHTVWSFEIWDRYLLGLAPIAALLLARVVLLPWDLLSGHHQAAQAAYGLLLAAFLVVALLGPVQGALERRFPIGGDHGAYEGIEAVAAYFKANVPAGSIVFHRLLGWHYSFYMFGYPLHFYYYPSPEHVRDAVQRSPSAGKYIVFPSWDSPAELQACLGAGGWRLRDLYRTYRADGTVSFTIYRIEPR